MRGGIDGTAQYIYTCHVKIVADENIHSVAEAFASLGDVELIPGREMRHDVVRDADILLVRSVTRVDEGLLAGSKVGFVGSATIGFEHVDRGYLQSRDIGFAAAPGSNANSVAEYVISALMVLAGRERISLAGKTAGIIGCGNVGSKVLEKFSALGVQCLVNDPPLAALGGHEEFVSLDAILQADIVTVHVPLTTSGEHPTFHMLGRDFFEKLKPGSVLINTARGAVIDNSALDVLLDQRNDLSVVLDVWEGEPQISMSLLEKTALATPHVAGYSLEGKLRGTEMIYHAACHHLKRPVQWRAADELPVAPPIAPVVTTTGDVNEQVRTAVLDRYDVSKDDEQLRKILSMPPHLRLAWFDRLRSHYPVRQEFWAGKTPAQALDRLSQEILVGLGFTLHQDDPSSN